MIQRRFGAFETNSSSLHSMIIHRDSNPHRTPNYIVFRTGGFGWARKKLTGMEEKASYLYTSLALDMGFDEAEELLRDRMLYWGVEPEFVRPENLEWTSDFYIDHGPADDFTREMRDNETLMFDFLFDKKSYVITSNDNCDDDIWEWYSKETEPEPADEYVIFWKGN